MIPEPEGAPAHSGRGLLLRAALGGLLIVVLTAGAAATAGLLQVHQLVEVLAHKGGRHIPNIGITEAQAGAPQTILVLGSDRRWDDLKAHNKSLSRSNPARSDTIMLIRLDPHQPATSVLSLPRDLKVLIPGHGMDKINDAYSLGGPTLTLRTIKQLTGLKINHVINVNFHGFKEAVDAVGCVYVDVDHRYFHSNRGVPIGRRYSAINIQPGYQRLCGASALAFVRYRHTDSDIVRAARQQDFLRAAKDQVSSSQLIGERSKLVDIFASNTQTDAALDTTNGLLRILKLSLFSAGHPVRQIEFPAQFEKDRLPGGAEIDYVVASPMAIRRTVQQFLHPSRPAAPHRAQLTPRSTRPRRARRRSAGSTQVPGLVDARRTSGDVVARAVAGHSVGLPLYFPTRLTVTSRYDNPALRIYTVQDRGGRVHKAYRMVVVFDPLEGQYWGVEGTDWRTPPILQAKHVNVTRHGRRLSVYRDGSRIRLVAWRTPNAVYWVSNTLSSRLTNSQMLEIAATLTRRFSSH